MKRLIFLYGIRFQEDGRVDVFPAVEISVLGRRGKGMYAAFHIDSGATTSIVPLSDAAVLGLPVDQGKRTFVRGISGEPLQGYRHIVAVRLGEEKLRIPFIFVDDRQVPRILGREGVFTSFAVVFDEVRRRTAFFDSVTAQRMIDESV